MTLREKILDDIRLSPKRLRHTMGVEKSALTLAETHFPALDKELLSASALLHDFTKEYTVEQQQQVCERYGETLTETERRIPKLIHGRTAALIARNEYNLPPEYVSAIRYHTTGKTSMTGAECVIYFADYIEENRADEGCVAVRDNYLSLLASEGGDKALYKGMLFSFDMTVKFLLEDVKPMDENTVAARNWLIYKLKSM